jgi:hypothetical protein
MKTAQITKFVLRVGLAVTTTSNYNSTKVDFAYFGFLLGRTPCKENPWLLFQRQASCRHKLKSLDQICRGANHLFLWPTISPCMVRRSTRVRLFSIAGVSSEMCGISQRYSAMNQTGFSVVIQFS